MARCGVLGRGGGTVAIATTVLEFFNEKCKYSWGFMDAQGVPRHIDLGF